MAKNIVCYILKSYISESFPEGSLLNPTTSQPKQYMHYCPSVSNTQETCICEDSDLAPVFDDDLNYIVKINSPEDRLDVFNRKLKWGKQLHEGSHAYVKLRRPATNADDYAEVIVKYSGNTKIGMKIGVEIIEECYKGRGDKTVNYFECAERCGMLVDLDKLEPEKPTICGGHSDTTIRAGDVNSTTNAACTNMHGNFTYQQYTGDLITSMDVGDGIPKATSLQRLSESDTESIPVNDRTEQPEDENARLRMMIENLSKELKDQKKLVNAHENCMAELAKAEVKLSKKEEECSALQSKLSATEEKMSQVERQLKNKEQENEELDQYMKELKEHYEDDNNALEKKNSELTSFWEVDKKDLDVASNEIGSGGWGIVYKGKFKGVTVAVKKLYPHIVSEYNEKLVRREIMILSQVRHPNILLFMGAVMKGESSYIITELLDTDLRSAYGRGEILEESKRPILCNVAAALVYLHTNPFPILHRDVSSANVLLQAVGGEHKWKAKLSDFGSANVTAKAITPNAGAVIYAAPEAISESTQAQTDKVDVYSFGVLLCEVTLCSPPPNDRKHLFDYTSSIRINKPEFFNLAKMCTKHSPHDRPTMMVVLQKLNTFA